MGAFRGTAFTNLTAAELAAAGAVLNADTSTALMQFVIDDDTMATATDTVLSTSESIKAYVDMMATAGILIQGTWNATTNTPDITTTTTTGYAWIVSVAGTTDLGGITDWEVNDWAVKTATGWAKIDNTEAKHASTHEDGGDDEISVAGLSGELADDQPPKDHAADHQNGGSDEVSVAGLSGLLADDQNPTAHASDHQHGGTDEVGTATPAANAIPKADGSGTLDSWVTASAPLAHAASHENGGGDEISVAGLSGLLADDQNPTAHASEHTDGTDDIQDATGTLKGLLTAVAQTFGGLKTMLAPIFSDIPVLGALLRTTVTGQVEDSGAKIEDTAEVGTFIKVAFFTTAPVTPTDGDVWLRDEGGSLFLEARVSGVTKGIEIG